MIIAGLAWIELRRLWRGWRWRALVAIVAALCYLLDRGDGFGQGARVAFPGAGFGVFLFGMIFCMAGMVLAADVAGQPDRHRARLLLDTRPVSGVALALARWIAVVAALVPLAVMTSAYPWLWRRPLPLVEPSVLMTLLVLVPLSGAGAGAGLLGRRLGRSDAGGFLVGGLLVAPALVHRLGEAEPATLFTEFSAGLGLLVPWPVALGDAAASLLWGVALALAAGVGTPSRMRRTELATLDPPTRPRLPLLANAGRRVADLRTMTGAAALTLIAVAGMLAYAAPPLVRACRDQLFVPTTMVDDEVRVATELATDADGRMATPRIVERRIRWQPEASPPLRVELDLMASQGAPQRQAVVTFGAATRWVDATGASLRSAEAIASRGGLPLRVLTFDPPLDATTTTTVTIDLEPDTRRHARAWARTRHPVYATFRDVPLWYGEGVALDVRRSAFSVARSLAPFVLTLPDRGDQRWFCGAAAADQAQDGWVTLHQPASAVPESLFAAAMIEVRRPPGPGMDVRFVVEPRRRALAEALAIVWGPRLDQVQRALGPPPSPIVFHETPGQVRSLPLALASSELDVLEALLPKYDDFEEPTAPTFDAAFAVHHRVVVEHMIAGSFLGFEDPRLLRDAAIEYLHVQGLRGGMTRDLVRDLRTDFLLVPWKSVRPRDRYPFDLTPADEDAWRGPLLDAQRPLGAVPAPDRRRVAFHHQLRGVLGDRAYAMMWQDLRARHAGRVLTVDILRAAAERQAGRSLDVFFQQWLVEAVIPRLRLREASVVLVENPQTRQLEYTTTIVAANEGEGVVEVPVLLATDADPVETMVEFGPGATRTITLRTLDRPISVTLDPEGWLVQMPLFDTRTKRPEHPQLLLKTVREAK